MEETVIDYSTQLTEIAELLAQIVTNSAYTADFLKLISGVCVFLVVVILCYFVYKFFRIFF